MDDWIYVLAPYNKIYDTYIDEHEIIQIIEKEVLAGEIGRIVQGDSNSQFITFEVKRFYDHIDLSDKLIKFIFIYKAKGKTALTTSSIYSSDACNICYNEKKVRFSWLLPEIFADQAGTVMACISFIGQDSNEHYQLKTTTFDLVVEPSIDNTELIEAAGKSWFEDMEARVYKVEQASGEVDLDYNTLANKPTFNGQIIQGDVVIDLTPIATATTLGSVKVVPKTDAMTALVGISPDGLLYSEPGGGGGGGEAGKDGFSPLVSMQEEADGTLLTIVDKNGAKTTHIKNGKNGADGIDGTDGADGIDGFTPVPSIETVEGGIKISITKKEGDPAEATILNGKDGADGSSVTVTIDETVEKEHKVTFTDKNGDKEITIKDGADGKDGKALIDDAAESGTDVSWSVDKIISYVQKVLEDIENGTY